MTATRLSVPKTAKKGEIIELKALIQHPMETGYRRDLYGESIPRNIIKSFECFYNDELVFSAEYNPSIAANPLISFHTKATESGTLLFVWTDDTGASWSDSTEISVS